MDEMPNYSLAGKPQWKARFGRPRQRWEDNTENELSRIWE
jgi:hypothetical protein